MKARASTWSAGAAPTTGRGVGTWARVGALTALAIVFGYIETFVPIPVPGVKLGLANIVVLVALQTMPLGWAAAIAALKTLATGLLFGSPLAFAYSAAGTALSFAAMAALACTRKVHVVSVSMVGALFHTEGQLLVAQLMLGTAAIWVYAPLLAATSLAAGCVTGLAACFTLRHLDAGASPVAGVCEGQVPGDAGRSAAQPGREAVPGPLFDADALARALASDPLGTGAHRMPVPMPAVPDTVLAHVSPALKLAVLVALTFVVFNTGDPVWQLGCLAASVAIALVSRVGLLKAARRALPLVIVAGAAGTVQMLLDPIGPVVAQVGALVITAGGIHGAATLMLRLVCPVLLSAAFVRSTPPQRLLASFARLARPLGRMGIDTGAVCITLGIAFSFVPVQTRRFELLREGASGSVGRAKAAGSRDIRQKTARLAHLFAQLIDTSLRDADALARALQALERAPRAADAAPAGAVVDAAGAASAAGAAGAARAATAAHAFKAGRASHAADVAVGG